jgi:glucosamine--fructose-6-phosphate aminotransferase (isomerizing)
LQYSSNLPSLEVIRQQPERVEATLQQFFDQTYWSASLSSHQSLEIVASGYSYYAALIGQYLLAQLAGVPTAVVYGSEYLDCASPLLPKRLTLVVGLPDEEINQIQQRDLATKILPIKPESFLVQVMFYYGLTLYWGQQNQQLSPSQQALITQELQQVPQLLEKALTVQIEATQALAKKLQNQAVGVILGRGINYPLALEGARLLQQTGFHALGYPGGEFHHGPKAVVSESLPMIAIAPPQSKVYPQILKNALDMQSLGATIYGITTEGQKQRFQQIVPIPEVSEWQAPFVNFLAFQLLAVSLLKN